MILPQAYAHGGPRKLKKESSLHGLLIELDLLLVVNINYTLPNLNRQKTVIRHRKQHLPSSTPVTIEAKLSSSKIISAACLLTSLPAIPMATPKFQENDWLKSAKRLLRMIVF